MLFERELRSVLDGLAPQEVPGSLGAKIAAVRAGERRSSGWLKRLATAAFSAMAVLAIVALGAVTVLRTGWSPPTTRPGGSQQDLSWGTQMATLAADRLTVEVGGRTFVAPRDMDYIHSDPGSSSYRTLELAWHVGGTEMKVSLYLGADTSSWWIQHIRTYDGREPGDWIFYLGPSFRMPLGESYAGTADLLGIGPGGVGRLRINAMNLSAFEPGTVPPAFDDCRTVAPRRNNPLGPPVAHPVHPDVSEFGIATGSDASEVQSTLVSQGICHEFRLEFPSINRGQIWCTAPPGKVREFAFGSSGQIIVFIEDATSLPLDTELPQVVGC
jgi:hypothetical protein